MKSDSILKKIGYVLYDVASVVWENLYPYKGFGRSWKQKEYDLCKKEREERIKHLSEKKRTSKHYLYSKILKKFKRRRYKI